MKRVIRYVKPHLLLAGLTGLSGIVVSTANVWIIEILKQIIDSALAGEIYGSISKFLFIGAAAILVGALSNYLATSSLGILGANVLRDLRNDCLNHIMCAHPDFAEKSLGGASFGDRMERLSSDIEELSGYMQTYCKDCVYVPMLVIAFAVYLAYSNLLLAFWCLAPLVFLVPYSIWRMKPVKHAQASYVRQLGRTNDYIQEAFDGAEVIKAYGLQENREKKYEQALKNVFAVADQNDLRQYRVNPIESMIRNMPTATALCVGGYLVLKGNITMGVLAAFLSAVQKLKNPLANAYQLVVRTQMAAVAAGRVVEILDVPEERSGIDMGKPNGEEIFNFRSVSFIYPGDGSSPCKEALHQFDLKVYRGQRIALVGRSGSGKSTVLKLLCRQYEVEEGELLYYGRSCRQIDAKRMRENIALLSQDTILFPMSIRNNLRVGNPDAGEEQLVKATKKAGCDGFIQAMPKGYDSVLEERGANLSGGQCQRIALARALLKNAEILLLDEPTAALDRETEQHIIDSINEIAKLENKTVVMVAHRLSTIVDYDRIIVMEEGRIVEQGTHKELMERQGSYCQMFRDAMRTEVYGD